uniref:hypothetical protein n=1 Tax=Nostoc sp. 106C TaxID=1932667 RepID=UPI000B68291B
PYPSGTTSSNGKPLRVYALLRENILLTNLTQQRMKQPCFLRQGRFIRNDMYFVNMIGDKYQGKSHKLVTILILKMECLACFLSPEPLRLRTF